MATNFKQTIRMPPKVIAPGPVAAPDDSCPIKSFTWTNGEIWVPWEFGNSDDLYYYTGQVDPAAIDYFDYVIAPGYFVERNRLDISETGVVSGALDGFTWDALSVAVSLLYRAPGKPPCAATIWASPPGVGGPPGP